MAAKFRVKLNKKTVRDLERGDAMTQYLLRVAQAIQQQAGDGFAAGVDQGARRSRGYVVTSNPHGKYGEAKDQRLTRAIDAGRI